MKKFKLLLTAVLLAASASTALADTDYTATVKTGQSDWHGSEVVGNRSTADGTTVNMIGAYDKTGKGLSHDDDKVFYQTVEGLDSGTYKVTLCATAQNDWCTGFASNYSTGASLVLYSYDIADLFATSGETTVKTPVKAKGWDGNRNYTTPGEYTLNIYVSNGTLEMGMLLNKYEWMDWFTIQIKSLTLVSTDDTTLELEKAAAQAALNNDAFKNVTGSEKSDLEAAIAEGSTSSSTDINKLINAFESVTGRYDACAVMRDKVTTLVNYGYAKTTALTTIKNAAEATLANATAADETIKTIQDAYLEALYNVATAEGCTTRLNFTNKITNPNPAAADNITGWTLSETSNAGSIGTNQNDGPQTYPNANVTKSSLYYDGGNWNSSTGWTTGFSQTVTSIPAGKYRVAFISRAATSVTFTFNVKSGDTQLTEISLNSIGGSNGDYGGGWDQNIADFTLENDGDVTLTVRATTSAKEQWQSFTDFTLMRLDYDYATEAEAVLNNNDYKNITGSERTAITNAVTADNAEDVYAAINTFKAAKTSYDSYATVKGYTDYLLAKEKSYITSETIATINGLLAKELTAEVATEVATSLQEANKTAYNEYALAIGCTTREDLSEKIVNGDASYNKTTNSEGKTVYTTDGWEVTTSGSKMGIYDDKYWSGETHPYFNPEATNWGDGNWSTTQTQTISDLSAGTYRLSFTFRGQNTLETYSVSVNDAKTDLLPHAIGDTGGVYGSGWFKDAVDFTLENDGDATITFTTAATAGWQWACYTDLALINIGIDPRPGALTAAAEALNDTDYANVTGSEKTNLEAAIADNSEASADDIYAAINTFKAAKESYDNFVATKTEYEAKDALKYPSEATAAAYKAAIEAKPNTAEDADKAKNTIATTYLAARFSDASAEGCATRVPFTSAIENADASNSTVNWSNPNNIGTLKILSSEKPVDPNGKDYSYFDVNWGKDHYGLYTLTTDVLPKGTYRIAVMARAKTDVFETYRLIVKTEAVSKPESGEIAISTEGSLGYCDLKQKGNTGGDYGKGWYENYVDFKVDEATELDLYIDAHSNVSNPWLSFTNLRLTKLEAIDEAYLLNEAKENANESLDNSDYTNVTGKERSELVAAITNDSEATSDDINNLVAAFKAAKTSYDNYVAVKAYVEAAKEKAKSLIYYTEDDINAIDTAADTEVTSAETAVAATEAIYKANANAVYNAAMAKTLNLDADRDYTSFIINPNTEVYDKDAEGFGWTLDKADGGAVYEWPTNQYPTYYPNEAYQDGTHHYFNPANWGGNDWTTNFQQTTEAIPAGRYRLAVAARGETDLRWYRMRVNSTDGYTAAATTGYEINLTHTGGSIGDYGNGWYENVLDFDLMEEGTLFIQVQACAKTLYQWQSFTGFRLIQLLNEKDMLVAKANEALASDDYKNVVGSERTDLKNAAENSESSVEDVTNAYNTFVNAKATYDAYADVYAKAYAMKDDAKADLWSEDWVEPAKLTSADDATTRTTSINNGIVALRYSYAVAEGRTGTANRSNLVPTTIASDDEPNGWLANQGKVTACTADANDKPTYNGESFDYFQNTGMGMAHSGYNRVIVKDLPAGEYRAAIMARGSSDKLTQYRFAATWKTDSVAVNAPYTGTDADAGGVYGNGWWENIVNFTITEQQNVQFSMFFYNEGGVVMGFGNLRLTQLNATETATETANKAIEECSNVNGEELEALNKAIESGDAEAIEKATKALEEAKESYDAFADEKVYAQKLWDCFHFSDDYYKLVYSMQGDQKATNAKDAADKAAEMSANYTAAMESATTATGYSPAKAFEPTNTLEWATSDDNNTLTTAKDATSYYTDDYYTCNIDFGTNSSVIYKMPVEGLSFGYYRFALKTRIGKGLNGDIWVNYEGDTTKPTAPAGAARRFKADLDSNEDTESENETTTTGGNDNNIQDIDTSNARTLPRGTICGVTADGFDAEAGDYGNGWNQNIIDFDIIDKTGTRNVCIYIELTPNAEAKARRRAADGETADGETADTDSNTANTVNIADIKTTLVTGAGLSTGIENVALDSRLTINYENDVVYDLYGRRVANPTHGIYIINGRKVVVK